MIKFVPNEESVALEQLTMTELVRRQDQALLAEDWMRVLVCTALLARKSMGLFHHAATKADLEMQELNSMVERGLIKPSDLDIGKPTFPSNLKQQNESGNNEDPKP